MTKEKIEKLTEEQEALFPVYRDRWLKIGLSTAPADHAKAEDAIRRAYKAGGIEAPSKIVWATSPLAGALVVSILKNGPVMEKIAKDFRLGDSVRASVWDSVRDSVWDSVWDSVRDSVRASVGDSVRDSVWASVGASVGASVRDSVWDSVRASVWDSVRASVWDSVWDSVGASVGDSVRASVRDSVWDSVRASVWDSVRDALSWNSVAFGQHDAGWLAFYQYFLEVLKIESAAKLIPLMDLAENANWFFPYKEICVVSEKPTDCHLSGTRIHREGGPAVRYQDGFSVWALNGVRVPQWLAETDIAGLDPSEIMKLPNAEQRKEGIKRVGIDRMRKHLNVEVVHSWKDYELWTLEFESRRIGPYLKMVNDSTGQIHVEGVGEANGAIDANIKTCQQALAWRGGLTVFEEPKWSA